MNLIHSLPRALTAFLCLATLPLVAAPIPGLFNTGVGTNGVALANGSINTQWRLIQSADPASPGPNVIVVMDNLFPIVAGPWLASSAISKWVGPKADQSGGSAAGDYKYRITFDLTGLEASTAVISGRWSSDNAGPELLLNGVPTGFTSDGNFGGLGNSFTITTGFVDGTNTLDFLVNNAGTTANPTALRVEFLSATADLQPPPGTPPTITASPASATVGFLDPATFTVGASGSRPFT